MHISLNPNEERAVKVAVGERLRLAREANGLRLVDMVGLYPVYLKTASVLANWESGDRWPHPMFVMQLCADWKLTMDYFYRGLSVASKRGGKKDTRDTSEEPTRHRSSVFSPLD